MSPGKPKPQSAPAAGAPTTLAGAQSTGGSLPAGSSLPTNQLTLNEQVGHYVEMWKKSVDVQQHFNDIEWRIRGLALTVATFAFGAGGVIAKDGTMVGPLSLAALVVTIGLALWYAFYFVDQSWYHPLLKAAVEHGTIIENEIKKTLPQAGMTATITDRSPQTSGRVVRILSGRKTMHSDDKLRWFYRVGAAAFVAAAIALQLSAMLSPQPKPPQPIQVQILPGGAIPSTGASVASPTTTTQSPSPSAASQSKP